MTIFSEKNALIFGGATGIGRAIALEFTRRGASVAIADINLAEAETTAEMIRGAGGKAFALTCDVMSDASVAEAAASAENALGQLDIVMNNVGAILHGNPQDIPIPEWERIMSLNFFSVVRSNAVFLPKMIARGHGHIVNTASFAGLYPFASTRMPYVAAKAAVIALSESMALHLHPQGIKVSCLCPGPIMTGVADNLKVWTPDLPLRAPGAHLTLKTVEDVATTLADGMEAGRMLIPTHEEAFATLQERAADPDAFIEKKAAEFARGEIGKPQIPEELKAIIAERMKAKPTA